MNRMNEVESVFPSTPFGNIIWFTQFLKSTNPIIDVGEHFEKMSYRNRYEIGAANGRQLLSIPLLNGRGQRIPMKDVQISYAEDWQSNHSKSWESAYRRTPYYEFYQPYFEILFKEQYEKLVDFNFTALKIILKLLKVGKNWQTSEQYIENCTHNWKQKNALNLVDDISINQYIQPFEHKHGFVANLSIIDLLFCEGPNAIRKLK